MFQKQERMIAACLAGALLALATPAAQAQAPSGDPIKIGYGISQTGGLAPNGKSALLAQKIWEEDVNTKGGLLGRAVKLVYYDGQTNPATVPGIY
jgi:branched-chain amino acid transport system substrate-binding protein